MVAPSREITAILFDLDGVLVDAAEWHRKAFDIAIYAFGCDVLSQKEHEETFNGLSTKRKLEILVEQGRLPNNEDILNGIHNLKQQETVKIISVRCQPNQRLIELIDYAKIAVHSIAVVTNCSRLTTELMLRRSCLFDEFDFIVTNNDVGGRIKPNPWPYMKACLHFGLKRKQVLAIDDTHKGIVSAMEAGCRIWKLEKFEDLTIDNLKKQLHQFPL